MDLDVQTVFLTVNLTGNFFSTLTRDSLHSRLSTCLHCLPDDITLTSCLLKGFYIGIFLYCSIHLLTELADMEQYSLSKR